MAECQGQKTLGRGVKTGSDAAADTRSFPFLEVFSDGRQDGACEREVPVEAPVAIEINGIGYAVMMATPSDLEDFVTGFVVAERMIGTPREIEDIDVASVPNGWIVRLIIPGLERSAVLDRARRRVVESSCGLCGVENLEALATPLPIVAKPIHLCREAVFAAVASLRGQQALGQRTGAAHAAAFCRPDGTIAMLREDVGRHNALDKLVGGLFRAGMDVADGFALLSARCSYELVEKSVLAGLRALVTVSAPTTLALERAAAAGLPLYVLARSDSYLATEPVRH